MHDSEEECFIFYPLILYMSFVLFMILENVLIRPNVYKMCIIICNTIYSENKYCFI